MIDVHALFILFPTNNSFAVPMHGENFECFLDGLLMLFKQVGGVPVSLRINTLSLVLKKMNQRMS